MFHAAGHDGNAAVVPPPYPGSGACAGDVLAHADCYRAAALALLAPGIGPASRPPGRLCAIQAIELYLNAYLLNRGRTHCEIRGLRHDMAARAALARAHGIVLRRRTAEHLASLAANREYLLVRYAPERAMNLSQVNRMTASLEQVAGAVHAAVAPR